MHMNGNMLVEIINIFMLHTLYNLRTELLENKSIYFYLTKNFGISIFQASLIWIILGFSQNYKVSKLTSDKIIENSKLLINNKWKIY